MKIKLCDKYFIEVSVSSYDLYEIIPEKVVNRIETMLKHNGTVY